MSNDAVNPVAHHPLINVYSFLLVSLSVETILQESTIYRRRERLRKIAGGLGLGDAYDATIERIKAQGGDKSRLGMAALMWISHAERPLKADELCDALAVELGSTDFNDNNAPSMSTLVGCCQGLNTVDKEGSTVRLIHFTLQEYLSIRQDIFGRPHSTMAEICLTYLNSQQVKAISADPHPATLVTRFLEYCSLYGGAHAKRELSDSARSLALAVFMECDDHISLKLLLIKHMCLHFNEFQDYGMGLPFGGLHWASFFGIGDLVAAFIEMKCYDINEGGPWGCTPLAFATLGGHEDVVKMLLECGEIDPDKPDFFDQTPLSRAAAGGHERVVKILLSRQEVDPNKPDQEGETPLVHAACNGHEEVVKALLAHEEVDPDKPSGDGNSPLSWAAWKGHEGVVKILLEREEVNPHKPNDAGLTPAAYAVERGHKEVVEILLAYEGADPDKPETWDATLLWGAAVGGDEEAAKMLLKRHEVNPNDTDNEGRTLLSHAAGCGREGVVKILLGCGGV